MSKNNLNYLLFWQETDSRMKDTLPEQDYSFWFTRISYDSSKDRRLVLSVPSQFILDKVSAQFKSPIENMMSELTGEDIKVEFIVKKLNPDQKEALEKQAKEADEKQTVQAGKTIGSSEKQKTQTVSASVRQASNLNPAYRFETFVTGDNSSFAYNACYAISKNPGTNYNPCLIYGGVGLGKTHLLQSIGNYILDHTPMLKVVYVTAEMFTNEFIQAISDKKTNSFKNKYRKVDVLLIDDIHFLQGKDSTQEELFHTFNNLYDTNKQLVFTCDRPISELKDLTARLRSRFERGLNVDLQPPNYETRMAILRLKCEEKNSYMSDDVLDYISRNINTNVRDLEASLTKLIAYSDLLGQEITLDIAKEQLKTSYPIINANQALSIDTIIKVVAEYFNISPYDIRGKKRTKSLVQPRQIAMYIARHITDFSTTEIGNDFGGRDHTTVMHAIQRIEGLIKSDSGMSNTIQKLEREIQNYKKN
ncbi:MAG: chromosomal replication initiator protein DnaA [Sphaerochaetaceae bacterium]|jgi:chromosomal replication initiator protein